MVGILLSTSFNSGMSLQALIALPGHVSTEMTLRYAALAAPAVRTAYEEAMSKARTRLALAIAPVGQPIIPGRVEWLRAEMLKTRVARLLLPPARRPHRPPRRRRRTRLAHRGRPASKLVI